MKRTASSNLRTGDSESGVVLLFGIFVILGVTLVAALLIDIGVAELRMRELQSQIDGSSLAGANILDLTSQSDESAKLRSFRFAKEAAWKYLHLAGIVETDTPPTDGCDQESATTLLDKGEWQCTRWILGARTISIERGLYYRHADGDLRFVSLEGEDAEDACDAPYLYNIFPGRCDPFGLVPGELPEIDAFWFANAVKIVVTDDTVRGFFSMVGLFERAEFTLSSRDTISSKAIPGPTGMGSPDPW
jgi:hypothetical protein